MKTKILMLLILIPKIDYAQDTIRKVTYNPKEYINPSRLEVFYWIKKEKQIFAISPLSKRIENVNGLVFGFGHIDNKLAKSQTINGLNVEVNPAPIVGAMTAFMFVMYLPEILSKNYKNSVSDTLPQKKKPDFRIPSWDKTPALKINGLNLSTGCFFTNTSMNGLTISFGNKFESCNGVSIAPLGTMANKQNGIAIGLINANNDLNGLTIGGYNQSFQLDGLQMGLFNQCINNQGLQIGFFNRSYSKGFQLGVWNKNGRRSMPIFNW